MRRFTLVLAALTAVASLSGCYITKQGAGQAQLLMSRTPVSKLMTAEGETDLKTKLGVIQDVKAFGEYEIGLRQTSNYQDFVKLDRDAVSYVVSAAPKDKLEPYTGWFPVIGNVPYKGYFDKADAEALKKDLDAQGYDTILRGVPAFSTLGWLPDPV